MPDSTQTVTISATLVGDVAQKAAENAAAFKGMADAVTQSSQSITGASAQMGTALDANTAKTTAQKSASEAAKKSTDDLGESFWQLTEKINTAGESITERMTYPLQQLTWALEGAAAATVAYGLSTYSGFQQASLQLNQYTGSVTASTAALKELKALRDPTSLGALTGIYGTLMTTGGESSSTALAQTKSLANAGAAFGPQAGAMEAQGATALAQIQASGGGPIGSGQVQALARLYPQIYALLGQTTGQSANGGVGSVQYGLQHGQTFYDPNLISQLEATPQSKNGQAAFMGTFAGGVAALKTSLGDVLASFETPLALYLTKSAGDISTWATGVETRFGTMGKTLFSQFSSGNMGGFDKTLGGILGSKTAGDDITAMIDLGRTLAGVLTGFVIPAVKDASNIILPLLSFMSDHRTTTEALILALGGLFVMSKAAVWGKELYTSFKLVYDLFSGLIGIVEQLMMKFIGFGPVVDGLAAQEDGLAASTTAADTALETQDTLTAGGAGEGAAGAAAGGSVLGPVATGAAISYLGHKQDAANIKKIAGPSHNITLGGAYAHSDVKKAVDFVSSGVSGLAHTGSSVMHDIGGLFGGHHSSSSSGTTNHIGQVNVTIPGSGNPEKVANAVPKGLNDNINSNTARIQRRSGKVLTPNG